MGTADMRRSGHLIRRGARCLTVVGLACVLVSCGGDAAPEDGEVETVQPTDGDVDGAINLCSQTDTSGDFSAMLDAFMEEHPDVQAQHVDLGNDTDTARTQMVQRMEGGNTECDLFQMDVTWVSEFAAQGWIMDQTDLIESLDEDLIETTVESAYYEGSYWGTPHYTDASLIYYLPERVPEPTSWQQLHDDAAENKESQYLYQAQQYEGLTVNFLELLHSAGGGVLDDQGNVIVDSGETREVLEFMREGFETEAVPRSVQTYIEDDSRLAFEGGEAGYQRNWPFAYGLLTETDLADEFDVAPLPGWKEDGPGTGILGGRNLAIAANSENPEAAAALVEFAASSQWQQVMATEYSRAPVIGSVYEAPEVEEELPFAEELREAVENAESRPASPVYPQISRAIYENVYAAISGDTAVDEAVEQMTLEIEDAQETF